MVILKTEQNDWSGIINWKPEWARLVTFRDNYKLPIHRWYPYIKGFSAVLVQKLIKEFNLNFNSWILDPFCGCGTTLLEAKNQGINSTGIDFLDLPVFISKVKTNSFPNVNLIKENMDWLLERSVEISPNIDRLKKLQNWAVLEKAFPGQRLMDLMSLVEALDEINDPILHDILKLALLRVINDVSEAVKDGMGIRWRVDDKFAPVKISDVKSDYKNVIEMIIHDLNSKTKLDDFINQKINHEPIVKVMKGDSRNLDVLDSEFDAVITSPPYLNKQDYAHIYKLESFIVGWYINFNDYTKSKNDAFRSNVEAKHESRYNVEHSTLEELQEHYVTFGVNNPKIPEMVQGYFDDFAEIFMSLSKVMKKGSKTAIVANTTSFSGKIIPVDFLLADISVKFDFTPIEIRIVRNKNISAQQIGKYGKENKNYEYILFLDKN